MIEPKWLQLARQDLGVAEIAGPTNNPRIMQYYKAANANWAKSETVPWCGAANAAWVAGAGFPVPAEAARARAWLDWGTPLEKPRVGAITILQRGADPASGHVCQWLEDRGDRILVIGGNQGDAVSITSFPKRDVLGYRWPPGADTSAPAAPQTVVMPASVIKPLYRSRTIQGTLAGVFAAVLSFAEWIIKASAEWTAALTELGPIKSALIEAGANGKAVGLGLSVWAAVKVLGAYVDTRETAKAALPASEVVA